MSGDPLDLDAIEAAWADSPALISNIVPALVAEVRRLRGQALGPEPRCRKGNVLKYHANPCGVGCEYPAPSP